MDIQKLEQIGKIVGAKNVKELAALIGPNSRATFPQLELDGRKDVPLAEVAPSLGAV